MMITKLRHLYPAIPLVAKDNFALLGWDNLVDVINGKGKLEDK